MQKHSRIVNYNIVQHTFSSLSLIHSQTEGNSSFAEENEDDVSLSVQYFLRAIDVFPIAKSALSGKGTEDIRRMSN